MSYGEIGRYQTKGSQPPAEVLKKMLMPFNNNVDFLINGNTEDKANASLLDAAVIRYFKEVDQLPADDNSALRGSSQDL